MTKTSETIVFIGNEKLASGVECNAPILSSLIEAGYKIEAVILKQADLSGRKKDIPAVIELAESMNIPVYTPTSKDELIKLVKGFKSPIAVLAAYGQIVPKAVINNFSRGVVNIHPSLLPKYRGSTPIESAILNGDKKTGVSLMKLAPEMDAGPLFGVSEIELSGDEAKQDLYDSLAEIGAQMLLELLPGIIDGSLIAVEQDHDRAEYVKVISKDQSAIDWSKSAKELEREIRAYSGWPGSRTTLAGVPVTVLSVAIIEESGNPGELFKISKSRFGVYCAEGALEVLRLKPDGKKEMNSAGFIAGYGSSNS